MPCKITLTLADALSEYLELREGMAHSTFNNDRIMLRRFIREVGDQQVHLLTPRTVELWAAKEARRMKGNSFNKEKSRLSGFLGFCTRRGWLDSDPLRAPAPRPSAPRAAPPRTATRFPTPVRRRCTRPERRSASAALRRLPSSTTLSPTVRLARQAATAPSVRLSEDPRTRQAV